MLKKRYLILLSLIIIFALFMFCRYIYTLKNITIYSIWFFNQKNFSFVKVKSFSFLPSERISKHSEFINESLENKPCFLLDYNFNPDFCKKYNIQVITNFTFFRVYLYANKKIILSEETNIPASCFNNVIFSLYLIMSKIYPYEKDFSRIYEKFCYYKANSINTKTFLSKKGIPVSLSRQKKYLAISLNLYYLDNEINRKYLHYLLKYKKNPPATFEVVNPDFFELFINNLFLF